MFTWLMQDQRMDTNLNVLRAIGTLLSSQIDATMLIVTQPAPYRKTYTPIVRSGPKHAIAGHGYCRPLW